MVVTGFFAQCSTFHSSETSMLAIRDTLCLVSGNLHNGRFMFNAFVLRWYEYNSELFFFACWNDTETNTKKYNKHL